MCIINVFNFKHVLMSFQWERHWLPVEALARGMYFLSEGTYLKATNLKGGDVPFNASGKEEIIPGAQTIDGE